MKFCSECGTLLIPRKEKATGEISIICRKCGAEFPPDSSDLEEYKLSFNKGNANQEKIAIIKEHSTKTKLVTDEDRETYEDYFKEIEESVEDDSGVEST